MKYLFVGASSLPATFPVVTAPQAYRYQSSIDAVTYNEQRIALADSIRALIRQQRSAYYQKANDSLTEVFIDTILYSPQKDKFPVFVITKNSNDKLLSGGSVEGFHYDAHCFIGRLKGTFIGSISWLDPYNLSNYKSLKSASDEIREIRFQEFKMMVSLR